MIFGEEKAGLQLDNLCLRANRLGMGDFNMDMDNI